MSHISLVTAFGGFVLGYFFGGVYFGFLGFLGVCVLFVCGVLLVDF